MINESLIRCTHHARVQMESRGISEEEVLAVLNAPDEVRLGTHSEELVALKHSAKDRVRVIHVSEPKEMTIITVTHY